MSSDGGATWSYVCEDAIGYGGAYDPDFVFVRDGTLFATTFGGLLANRDGCSYIETGLGQKFMSRVAQGPDNAVYASSVEDTDAKIYVSADNGLTFPRSAMPPGTKLNDWYQSIEVAPTDANRVYVSGYRLVRACPRSTCYFAARTAARATSRCRRPGSR